MWGGSLCFVSPPLPPSSHCLALLLASWERAGSGVWAAGAASLLPGVGCLRPPHPGCPSAPRPGYPFAPPRLHPETREEPGGADSLPDRCAPGKARPASRLAPLSSPPILTSSPPPRSLLCQLLQRGP